MNSRALGFLGAVLMGLFAAPEVARPNHYLQTADPQVVQMIEEIIYALGQGCQAGNMNACNAIPMAQQQAHAMLSAGFDCAQAGNQQACGFYQNNVWQLQQGYQMVAQAHQSGMLYQPNNGMSGSGAVGGAVPQGSTHAQRMQQIHNWGQQRLDYGRQSQQLLDNSFNQFMKNF